MSDQQKREVSQDDVHVADEQVEFRYYDPVHDDEKRIVASPYYGEYQEAMDSNAWIVTYEQRTAGTDEWDRYATDYADEKPEVVDV